MKFTQIVAATVMGASLLVGQGTFADGHAKGWMLDAENSRLAFGSIKKDTVGEVHSFETISGSVTADGNAEIQIDLTSVQTNIDIRNERMMEFVFGGTKQAVLTAEIDMEEVNTLSVGDMTVIDVEGELGFLGAAVEIETEMFVARMSETRVLAMTNDMIFVGTEDLGVTAGIDKLMALAKLPGITRTTPVTLRLVLDQK
ncbi:YceI family protein [Amylibacter sp. IMCC11727]|uniref:YceI family protein n=1 Tax=Amylibacter sp. IMCC11727 TaxID=3039851 RepID=UPI00244DAB9E|nr:YceI family protein [Amylibacter sp. IMCC11727]WGI22643.1 YceI family protein [Amylibacter sp. IMCC11727]